MKLIGLVKDLLYHAGLRGKKTMLEVGSHAPEFKGHTHQGKDVRLSDFRGRPVVLWFYPKADTPG